MIYKGYVLGTSFTGGLGLHFYNRYKNKVELDYKVDDEERLFNYQHSFNYLLFSKLNISWPVVVPSNTNKTFFDDLDYIQNKLQLEKSHPTSVNFPTKYVIIQLSNQQRSFIFNGKMYNMNFENQELFQLTLDKY